MKIDTAGLPFVAFAAIPLAAAMWLGAPVWLSAVLALLAVLAFVALLGLVVVLKHLPNLRRMAAGTEPRIFGDRP